jgi:predicted nucleic acid-binding protein
VISSKSLVLDANILLRAVLGSRVPELLNAYKDSTSFVTPDLCFVEARRNLAGILQRHQRDTALLTTALDKLAFLVPAIDVDLYGLHEEAARARIYQRDVPDWPVVATALLLNCPVWTEDHDFFGSGLATWTTNNVEIYLKAS